MKKQMQVMAIVLLTIPLAVLAAHPKPAHKKAEFTDQFPIEQCNFTNIGGNPHFILTPNRVLEYSNAVCFAEGECDELEELAITVLSETREITFFSENDVEITVNARVVEEFETADGEVTELSHNFYAACDGDVYYFGEEVWVPDDEGNLVGGADGPGAWLAGVNGARPGIIFPGGAALVGARYFQEIAEQDGAMDRAEHMETGLDAEVPAGDLQRCVRVRETTPLDHKEVSMKVYCADVGLVIDGDLELDAF